MLSWIKVSLQRDLDNRDISLGVKDGERDKSPMVIFPFFVPSQLQPFLAEGVDHLLSKLLGAGSRVLEFVWLLGEPIIVIDEPRVIHIQYAEAVLDPMGWYHNKGHRGREEKRDCFVWLIERAMLIWVEDWHGSSSMVEEDGWELLQHYLCMRIQNSIYTLKCLIGN